MPSLVADRRAAGGLRLGRYLPLSAAVTLAVLLLPLLAVAQLGPARTPLALALHVLLAVALSIAVARLLALAWTRHPHSSDLVFGDLLIWGWARRVWADRRLEAAARELGDPSADPRAQRRTLQRLSALLEARDPYTHGHSRRVARHAERIARGMGLSGEVAAKVRAAALVHDLGKINLPRSILTKPDRLTEAEFDLVKRHPGDGAALVARLGDPELAAMVRHHHERLDGCGYPDRLAGHDIPLGARIIAVADTFDAITSARPYRKPRAHRTALDIVCREAGTQLDPDAVDAFMGYYASRRSVGWVTVLVAAPQRLLSGLGGVQSGLAVGAAPLAQGACGVGVAAMLGACLATSGAPPQSSPAAAPKAAQVALASRPPVADLAQPGAAQGNRDTNGGSGRDESAGERVSTNSPGDELAPRALESPGRESPRRTTPGQPGGAGGEAPPPGSGQPGPSIPELPDVGDVPGTAPEPGEVTGPVTDQLPALQLPQVPPVALPQVPGVQLPNLPVPVPKVQVPGSTAP